MNATLESVEQAARLLSVAERAALANTLLRELDNAEGGQGEIESLWVEEAEDRLDAYLRGELPFHSLEDVINRVRTGIR